MPAPRLHALDPVRTGGRALAAVLTVSALLAGCGGGARADAERTVPSAGRAEAAAEPVARTGTFERRVFLTGSLEAARAVHLQVPRTPNWQVDLRWLEEDGALVAAGDKVVELDDSSFASDLESKETALAEKLAERERSRLDALGQTRQKELEVKRQEAALAKAALEAEVPEGVVPRQELEERRLALARARLELEKARAELDAFRRGAAADLEVLDIEIEKARREIGIARGAIEELTLEAPVDGVFLRGDHPWFGRTLQAGDTAWVGLTVASLPDLSSLVVEARLPDVDDGDIAPGMPALVTLDAYPEQTFRGRVREVAPVAQEEDGTSTRRFFATVVELEGLDAAARARLIPGMSARVEVIADRREEALLVSRSALPAGGSVGAPTRVRLANGEVAEVEVGPCNPLDCVVGGAAVARLAAEGSAARGATGAVGGGR